MDNESSRGGHNQIMVIRKLFKLQLKNFNKTMKSGLRLWSNRRFRQGSLISGRYRILQNLGGGSYGVAYLCWDTLSNRQCVLKRIDPMTGGRTRAELIYVIETSLLRRFEHPSIPKLYESFTYAKHLCFTMEYMEGSNLDQLLFHEGARFSEKEALWVIQKLLHIVAYIHAMGIIHRDISIANVIVGKDGLKLIDWGLARELKDEESTSAEDEGIDEDEPMEKRLRRRLHVTSDFYALGHLLLFLLYSTYAEKERGADLGWENELSLHPETRKLLRRLLLAEQPYDHVQDVQSDVDRIIHTLQPID
jgi:serine/threonine protein kinase, bacterial